MLKIVAFTLTLFSLNARAALHPSRPESAELPKYGALVTQANGESCYAMEPSKRADFGTLEIVENGQTTRVNACPAKALPQGIFQTASLGLALAGYVVGCTAINVYTEAALKDQAERDPLGEEPVPIDIAAGLVATILCAPVSFMNTHIRYLVFGEVGLSPFPLSN